MNAYFVTDETRQTWQHSSDGPVDDGVKYILGRDQKEILKPSDPIRFRRCSWLRWMIAKWLGV